VYRFFSPSTIPAEVYYATAVSRDSYFQGHYLKSVEVVKETETIEAVEGWFWIPTAQSRAQLISYLMEPETDDNLITWGWADHMLQVTPESVEEVLAGMLDDTDLSSLSEEQQAQLRQRAESQMSRRQRVPMMRVLEFPQLPVMRVAPYNDYQRNRFYRPW
jgi:hypothetical protein